MNHHYEYTVAICTDVISTPGKKKRQFSPFVVAKLLLGLTFITSMLGWAGHKFRQEVLLSPHLAPHTSDLFLPPAGGVCV